MHKIKSHISQLSTRQQSLPLYYYKIIAMVHVGDRPWRLAMVVAYMKLTGV